MGVDSRMGHRLAEAHVKSHRPRVVHPRVRSARPSRRWVAAGRWAALAVPTWMIRGYRHANAGDLAAAVAFNALVGLVPTFLLFLFVAGLFLKLDRVLATTIYTSLWGLPPESAQEAFDAVLAVRRNSGWFGVLSIVGFIWIGTNFISALARSMNRIYGVDNCGFMCEKRRGFIVIIVFAVLFLLATVAATVPTLFVNQGDLPSYFRDWALAATRYQFLAYAIGTGAAVTLFAVLYRVVPNAGQRLGDVWPGTVTAGLLFVIMAQAFPLYVRLLDGFNRYGALFGFLSLLLGWFWVLAHVLLFGTYVNATYQRHRRRRHERRQHVRQRVLASLSGREGAGSGGLSSLRHRRPRPAER